MAFSAILAMGFVQAMGCLVDCLVVVDAVVDWPC